MITIIIYELDTTQVSPLISKWVDIATFSWSHPVVYDGRMKLLKSLTQLAGDPCSFEQSFSNQSFEGKKRKFDFYQILHHF